jgi:hypothetical protein
MKRFEPYPDYDSPDGKAVCTFDKPSLDRITDVVLAHRPKPKSRAAKKRKRKEKKVKNG